MTKDIRLQFGMVRRGPVYTCNLYRDLNDGLLEFIDRTCHLGFYDRGEILAAGILL